MLRFAKATTIALLAVLLLARFAAAAPSVAAGTRARLALLATTDLHSHILSYDYPKLAENRSVGFERVASLIAQARREFPNTLLLDNGDTLQGSVLADYQAQVDPLPCTQELAIYRVMDAVGYDAANVGNHDFNYGLPYLNQVTGSAFDVEGFAAPAAQTRCAGPKFPLVLANVNSTRSGQALFAPYAILDRMLTATGPDGRAIRVPLRVGVIGLTPPSIMKWDRRWLDGRVYTLGLREAAQRYIPEMRGRGADLVVVLAHGGLDRSAYSPTMDNAGYHLSKLPGVDALLLGHSHQPFPFDATATPLPSQFALPGVDANAGLVNGLPAVMASHSGKHLGVIALQLIHDGARWTVDRSGTRVENRAIKLGDGRYVAVAPGIAAAVAREHRATIAYVRTPIGSSDFRMSSHFADVGDPSAIQLVNQAQADYVARYLQDHLPHYAALPLLSVAAAFRSGFGGGRDYTDVPAGNISISSAADLYLYPNALCAVKVDGAELKAWLETAAKRFNRIDPTRTAAQRLTSRFPAYNFDTFTSKELSYEIDVTAPLNRRIKNLQYRGQPISPKQEFIVATNSYRANGGGNFPGLDGSKTLFTSPDPLRDILIDYIKARKNLTRIDHGADRSWRFVRVATSGPVTFSSAQGQLALAQAAGLNNVSLYQADEGSGRGLSLYAIDLSR